MKNIGIDVKPPQKSCNDPCCPFHSSLKIRGKTFKGKVVSAKNKTTVVVEREFLYYIKKYMRYERRRSKVHAHLPSCIGLKENDLITIAECKPLAKSIAFVVIGKGSGE
jgi:small subunit ribosomal protein S17